jgi:DNA-binding transcriptional LysR family regulator
VVDSNLKNLPVASVPLVVVTAPSHPLAQLKGRVKRDTLSDHVQLVLTDRSGITGNRDQGVYSTMTWRLADLAAKHAMLRAGLGYGSLPSHLVEDDLASGRLVAKTLLVKTKCFY